MRLTWEKLFLGVKTGFLIQLLTQLCNDVTGLSTCTICNCKSTCIGLLSMLCFCCSKLCGQL